MDGLSELLLREVVRLKSAGAATGEEVQGKFAGAIEMSYAGLDTFFGGLEGVVGTPKPKILEAMAAEHTTGPGSESVDESIRSGIWVLQKTS